MNNKSEIPVDDLKAYEIIREEIRYEYSLMSNRVTWLIAAQAFLFVAYTKNVNVDGLNDNKFNLIILFLGILIGFVVRIQVPGGLTVMQKAVV